VTLQYPARPAHPTWCSPGSHEDTDARDDWHRSAQELMVLSASQLNDMVAVEVRINQHSERCGSGWYTSPATVELHVESAATPGFANLTAQEARRLAPLLLAGADVAEGGGPGDRPGRQRGSRMAMGWSEQVRHLSHLPWPHRPPCNGRGRPQRAPPV
jgi:hypothetical protein